MIPDAQMTYEIGDTTKFVECRGECEGFVIGRTRGLPDQIPYNA